MLNLMLIGGSHVDYISEELDHEKYTITKKYKFIEEAFDAIIENSGEFLDIDVILVLQHSIKSDLDAVEQIISLQESLEVSELKSKLYFLLKDREIYNSCEEYEDILKYYKTRILVFDKITVKVMEEVIEGKHDDKGIGNKLNVFEEEIVQVTEEEINQEENKEGVFKNVKEEQEENTKDKKKGKKSSLKEKLIRRRNGFSLLNSKKNKNEKELDIHNFKGVIAVTGDRGSGVSTTANNLAELCADLGKVVLLLDLDLERRAQSAYYPEFSLEEKVFTNTQLGVYTALNNIEMIEDVHVVVKDNLALISMSREDEYYVNKFADKPVEELFTSYRLTSLLGMAKGIYDIIIIDFPIEQMEKVLDATLIIDKFLLCSENNMLSLSNLFNVALHRIGKQNEAIVKSIIGKSLVVLTKYTPNSTFNGNEMTEDFVEELLTQAIYQKISVGGRINQAEVFYNQIDKNKRAIDLRKETREEFIVLLDNIIRR